LLENLIEKLISNKRDQERNQQSGVEREQSLPSEAVTSEMRKRKRRGGWRNFMKP
jgi:hypothetical protein